jgi:hypothetical protein
MGPGANLEDRRDLDWLVEARNRIQSLMLRLLVRWDELPSYRRQAVLGATFSLWRAVFLLVRDAEQALDLVDEAARKFLDRVVRTNAVTFSDDMRTRAWSSVYYVENAVQRIQNLTGHEFAAYGSSPIGTVRDAWNEAFEQLDLLVPGGSGIVAHDTA